MARSSTSFGPGNLAAVRHGARSLRVREKWRKDVIEQMLQHVDDQYPELIQSNPILRTILADELADLGQLRAYLNGQGGPVSPRGHAYKVADMKRAKARDVKDTMRLIALEQGKAGLDVAGQTHRELLELYRPKELKA